MTISINHPQAHRQVRKAMLAALVAASAIVTVYVAVQVVTDGNTRASSPPATVSRVDNSGLGQAPSVDVDSQASSVEGFVPDRSMPGLEAQLATFDAGVLVPSMVGLSAQGFIPDWSIPGLEAQLATFDAGVLVPSMVGLSAQGFIPDWSILE